MMDKKDEEYMDYLIHNRMQLTQEINSLLERLLVSEKKLNMATDCIRDFANNDYIAAKICLERMEKIK